MHGFMMDEVNQSSIELNSHGCVGPVMGITRRYLGQARQYQSVGRLRAADSVRPQNPGKIDHVNHTSNRLHQRSHIYQASD